MIVFEVSVNGERVCIAGEDDLAVLSASVTASGPLGPRTVASHEDESTDLFYTVGGLTGRSEPASDVHVYWKPVEPLAVGDVVQIKVMESDTADPPRVEKPANRKPGRTDG